MKRYLAVLLLLVLLVPIASAGEIGTPAKTPPPPGEQDTPGLQTHGDQHTPARTPPPPGEVDVPGRSANAAGEVQTPGSAEPLWMQILKLWLSMRNR